MFSCGNPAPQYRSPSPSLTTYDHTYPMSLLYCRSWWWGSVSQCPTWSLQVCLMSSMWRRWLMVVPCRDDLALCRTAVGTIHLSRCSSSFVQSCAIVSAFWMVNSWFILTLTSGRCSVALQAGSQGSLFGSFKGLRNGNPSVLRLLRHWGSGLWLGLFTLYPSIFRIIAVLYSNMLVRHGHCRYGG